MILPVGDIIYIGGDFNALEDNNGNTVTRNYFAAIDRVTGAPTSFNPNMEDKVWTLTLSPDESTLYAGGSFRAVGSESRNRVAAFNLASGALLDFDIPAPNNVVRALAIEDDTLYVGGAFVTVGGEDRERLAAISLSTGELDEDWAPRASDTVKNIIVDPGKVWVSGDFFRINSERARGLTTVDPVDGTLLPIDSPDYWVIDMVAFENQILVAGGGPGGTAAAWDRTTGQRQWQVSSNGNFQGVGAFGDYVYLGGHHTKVDTPSGRIDVGQMSRHNRFTGDLDLGWLPFVNGIRGTNAVGVDANALYIGGDFTRVSGERQEGFAIFDQPRN